MRKHYPIEVVNELKNTVYYPAYLGNAINAEKIAFGTYSVEADCKPNPDGKNTVVISKDVATALKFPNLGIPLHLFPANDTLFIGPLVGIFTSGFTPFLLRPIGERSNFFAKLLSVKKAVGAVPFVFGEEHINWEKGLITGFFFQQNGWETYEVPFPNVIYDRLPNRKSENRAKLISIKDRLQREYMIPWYNPGFFNKIDVYDRLQQDDAIARYLPETHTFSSFTLIERMLAEYGHVYLKPINGSLGYGIHQIIYDKYDSFYYCRFQDKMGENRLRKFTSLEALMHHVFSNRKLSHMLVQQGIHLIRVEQRPVDFRIHTNKDDNGHWQVTAIAAKVAGSGSVTTHLKNGGAIKTVEEVFLTKEEQNTYVNKLTNAALDLSKALERQVDGIIGEVGFDMGIDRQGDIWLFEANSKPGRSIFKHPQLRGFELLTRKLSLSFAVFLAERAISKPEEIFK